MARKPWDDHGQGGPWGDPDGDDKSEWDNEPGTVEDRPPSGDREQSED